MFLLQDVQNRERVRLCSSVFVSFILSLRLFPTAGRRGSDTYIGWSVNVHRLRKELQEDRDVVSVFIYRNKHMYVVKLSHIVIVGAAAKAKIPGKAE